MKLPVLDKLFLKGFIGPCLLSFFIVEFVLIMQNLWKHIDTILGKGYGILDFLELLWLFALASIPMALPLTILLSSVMVFGDMAEKYELSSIKTAGISFMRILRPGLIVAVGVCCFSILASNIIKPDAFEGFYTKMRDMKTNKLTFAFDEQIFNQEFKNYSIRIGKKYKDGRSIDDVMIYDHTDSDASVVNMIRAKKGQMYTTPDQKFLVMDLEDGYQVKEIRQDASTIQRQRYYAYGRPILRYTFSSLRKVFDLTDMLDLNVVNVSYKDYEMMNTVELIDVIDSLSLSEGELMKNNFVEFNVFNPPADQRPEDLELAKKTRSSSPLKQRVNPVPRGLTKGASRNPGLTASAQNSLLEYRPIVKMDDIDDETESLSEVIQYDKMGELYDKIEKSSVALSSNNTNNKNESKLITKLKSRYSFKLHQMYSFAMVCILFLFIGAPAGAIVKKGGFGYPLLIAIGFYISFIITSIVGEKLTYSGAVQPFVGAWLPCLILLPFAIYLSWRALHDNRPFLRSIFTKVRRS